MVPLCYRLNDGYKKAVWNLIREIDRNPNGDLEEKLKAIMNFLKRYFDV